MKDTKFLIIYYNKWWVLAMPKSSTSYPHVEKVDNYFSTARVNISLKL